MIFYLHQTKERPMVLKKKDKPKLVLMSFEETLVDKEHNLNILPSDLIKMFKRFQRAGLILGFNSDTPLQTMLNMAETLGMNGPLIAERGAIVMHGLKTQYTAPAKQLIQMTAIRHRFERALTAIFNDRVLLADSLDDPKLLTKQYEFAVITDHYRVRSLHFRVLERQADCKLVPTLKWLDETIALIKFILQNTLPPEIRFGDMEIEININNGSCAIHHCDTQNTCGVSWLLDQYKIDKMYMIGGQPADWIKGDKRVTHYAVQNAAIRYKTRCELISGKSHTQGVVALLQKITQL